LAGKAKANRKLRNDVARLQTELDRIKHLPEENEKLKAMLGPLED
jgi:cell shape-determining protein MreC